MYNPLRKLTSALLLVMIAVSAVQNVAQAQNTVGLLSNVPSGTYDGYTLFFPHNQGTIWLVDMCGEVAHQWDDPSFVPGNSAYLREDGSIVVCKGNGAASNPYIHAGGGGEVVEIRDWDNNLIWQWTWNDSLKRIHHDIAPMPNGNILMVSWEYKTGAEAIAQGRDPGYMVDGEVWPDYILEVQPVGLTGGTIVWEWHAWDHMIQDYDGSKANFGVVGDHPELININEGDATGTADWHHVNAIDYNVDLDQVMISVPEYNEFWIIDHSTTTAEAASHAGGLSGIGGDLMHRWGNPAAYDQGTAVDQKLFFQHDTHWMDQTLPSSHPDYGKVMLFNNQVGPDFSAVGTLDLGFNTTTWSYPMIGDVFGPADFEWTWTHPYPQDMHSTGLSSVQRLPNDNTFVCTGRFGYMIEFDPAGDIVWEYKTPLLAGAAVDQGTILGANNNLTFRAYRYGTSYGAFTGRDLTPYAFIETNPTTGICDELECPIPANLSATVSGGSVSLDWNNVNQALGYRLQGRVVGAPGFASRIAFASEFTISGLAPGNYEWMVRSGCNASGGGFLLSDNTALMSFTITAPREGVTADAGLIANGFAVDKPTVFPVPASEVLNVSLPESASASQTSLLSVVSIDGREMGSLHTRVTAGETVSLDITTLVPGVYYLLTQNEETGATNSTVFVKE